MNRTGVASDPRSPLRKFPDCNPGGRRKKTKNMDTVSGK